MEGLLEHVESHNNKDGGLIWKRRVRKNAFFQVQNNIERCCTSPETTLFHQEMRTIHVGESQPNISFLLLYFKYKRQYTVLLGCLGKVHRDYYSTPITHPVVSFSSDEDSLTQVSRIEQEIIQVDATRGSYLKFQVKQWGRKVEQKIGPFWSHILWAMWCCEIQGCILHKKSYMSVWVLCRIGIIWNKSSKCL